MRDLGWNRQSAYSPSPSGLVLLIQLKKTVTNTYSFVYSMNTRRSQIFFVLLYLEKNRQFGI